MKTDRSKNRSGSAFLVFSLLFGLGMFLSMTAQAQSQDDRYGRDRDSVNQNRRGRDWDRPRGSPKTGHIWSPQNRP